MIIVVKSVNLNYIYCMLNVIPLSGRNSQHKEIDIVMSGIEGPALWFLFTEQ